MPHTSPSQASYVVFIVSTLEKLTILWQNKVTLTYWGRVTHICISRVTIIVSDNGLSPGRRQAVIENNAGILLIGPLGTNFTWVLIEIHTFSFKKMYWKMLSGKWRPFCLGLNVLNDVFRYLIVLYHVVVRDPTVLVWLHVLPNWCGQPTRDRYAINLASTWWDL